MEIPPNLLKLDHQLVAKYSTYEPGGAFPSQTVTAYLNVPPHCEGVFWFECKLSHRLLCLNS